MKSIEMYMRPDCPYCQRAIALLTEKGAKINAINITEHPEVLPTMIEKANGGKTVPQIFIGGVHVGGCDDLFALDSSGKLDPMLVN